MAAPPNFIYSDPNAPPLPLQTQPGTAAETAFQVSNGEYFFQLASGGSANRNNFTGAVTINDPDASLSVEGNATVSQLNTSSVFAAEVPLILTGIGATVNGQSGTVTLESTNIDLNATAAIDIQAATTLALNATSTIGLVSQSGVINLSSAGISLESGTEPLTLNASSAGSITIGLPVAPSSAITIAGGTIALIQGTSTTGPPMTVQYGSPGDIGYLYDTTKNPILANTTIPVASYNQAFTTIYDAGFTPAVSGFYLITQTMTFGTVISFAPNAYVTSFLTLTNGSLNDPLPNSSVVFNITFNATASADTAQTYQNFVFLNAGQIVYNDIGVVGTVNLGSGGGLTITAQPFGCFY